MLAGFDQGDSVMTSQFPRLGRRDEFHEEDTIDREAPSNTGSSKSQQCAQGMPLAHDSGRNDADSSAEDRPEICRAASSYVTQLRPEDGAHNHPAAEGQCCSSSVLLRLRKLPREKGKADSEALNDHVVNEPAQACEMENPPLVATIAYVVERMVDHPTLAFAYLLSAPAAYF